jgi:hypothetical protein
VTSDKKESRQGCIIGRNEQREPSPEKTFSVLRRCSSAVLWFSEKLICEIRENQREKKAPLILFICEICEICEKNFFLYLVVTKPMKKRASHIKTLKIT